MKMTKRQITLVVQSIANSLIEQATRKAKGYDQGRYRDDDCMRLESIRARIKSDVKCAYALIAYDRAPFGDAPYPFGA
jgi:hypothetical protein